MIDLNNTDIVMLSALLICLVFQLIYYWGYLFKPYKYIKSRKKEEEIKSSFPFPVSVILTGENKARDLELYLSSLLEQNYPEYEVIFVNDASTDNTEDILKRLSLKYPRLYHTYIPAGSKNLSRKKLALTIGIKAAKYDRLLFTEPDSYPLSSNWVSRMASRFSDEKQIVLGLTILNQYPSKYIAYDYYWNNLQIMSLALMNHPYAADGHNLGYTKYLFEEQRGFIQTNFLDVGEDDLFVNQIATSKNVAVELSQESFIAIDMKGKEAWEEFKMHRSVSRKFYKKNSLWFWRGEMLSRVLFYILFILIVAYSLFVQKWFVLAVGAIAFLSRLGTQLIVINKAGSLLKQPKFYFSLLVFDMFQPLIDGCFYFYALLKSRNNYNWKYEKRR